MEHSHYFDKNPQAKDKPIEITTRINTIDFSFMTNSGVFSKNQLDFGSELLIKAFLDDNKKQVQGDKNIISPGEKSVTGQVEKNVLDLGCGYGGVGIIIKRLLPGVTLNMTDINERALELARQNATRNLVKFANIFASDALDETQDKYDIILTNPPVRAGKSVVFKFYEASFSHLKPEGSLYVVIQKKQGAPSTEEKLKQLFGNCEVIDKKSGYRIFKSVRQQEAW
jgi:16S rRNA (guanine1207-N2)-methyltransferase